jgi:hypothetical protein
VSNFKINRRSFITSTGAIFTLPLLESLFPFAKASAATNDPKRHVVMYMPSGTYNLPDRPIWAVNPGSISGGNTSLALSPFASNYGDIINLNNLVLKPNLALTEDHAQQAAAYLTGMENRNASMISFDQMIADKTGKAAIVLSGGETNGEAYAEQRAISYRNNKEILGISNPGDLYRQLLAKVVPSSGTPVTQPNQPVAVDNTKSILDASLADFNALSAQVSKTDKAKIDEFMTAVRTLESRVVASTGSGGGGGGGGVVLAGACAKPTLNSSLDNNQTNEAPDQYLPKWFAFNDLIKIAFACDITRSVSMMLDIETTHRNFAKANGLQYQDGDIAGLGDAHLQISHECASDVGYARCVTVGRVWMSVAVDLLNKLKSGADASGSSLADNTIIQLGYGVEHGAHEQNFNQRPLVLLGGRNMVSGGMSYAANANSFKDMYYTIASKMGLGFANFQGSTTTMKL